MLSGKAMVPSGGAPVCWNLLSFEIQRSREGVSHGEFLEQPQFTLTVPNKNTPQLAIHFRVHQFERGVGGKKLESELLGLAAKSLTTQAFRRVSQGNEFSDRTRLLIPLHDCRRIESDSEPLHGASRISAKPEPRPRNWRLNGSTSPTQ